MALLLPSLSIAAPPQACTEIGCPDGLLIEVPHNYRWQRGNYRFSFVLDKKRVLCTGRLPLRPCGERTIHCNQPGVQIMESGCALDPRSQGFGLISIDGYPQQVAADIRWKRQRIASLKAKPDYRTLKPNGPSCPTKCKQASLSLPIR